MDRLTTNLWPGRRLGWLCYNHRSPDEEQGLCVQVRCVGKHSLRDAVRWSKEAFDRDGITWLRRAGAAWELDSVALRNWLTENDPRGDHEKWFLRCVEWLPDTVQVFPEVIHLEERPSFPEFDSPRVDTLLCFNAFKEDVLLNAKKRIFLSHKGADKAVVERFYELLKLLGFDPWLDKEDMPAGAELHRGIRDGFRDSCAAVFFITPNFVDERYLRQEINFALEEKTEKNGRFAIVTLVFKDEYGKEGVVPQMLKSYVWKHPATDLEAFSEVVKALPIEVGPTAWRSGV